VYGKAAVELPVLTVIGKVLPSPLVNVIVLDDIDAVVNKDPVLVAIDGAQDADIAKLAVPVKAPINEPVNEPVL
jgi:putative N-acetylmannosamine-6-phosphate epimerase